MVLFERNGYNAYRKCRSRCLIIKMKSLNEMGPILAITAAGIAVWAYSDFRGGAASTLEAGANSLKTVYTDVKETLAPVGDTAAKVLTTAGEVVKESGSVLQEGVSTVGDVVKTAGGLVKDTVHVVDDSIRSVASGVSHVADVVIKRPLAGLNSTPLFDWLIPDSWVS